MADVVSFDPRTGEAVEVVAQETTSADVERLCAAAPAAAPGLEGMGRAARAALLGGVDHVAEGGDPAGRGFETKPKLLTTAATHLPHDVTEEVFGPVAVVARYEDELELFAALDAMPSSLTTAVLRGEGEADLPLAVSQELRTRAGRLVYDAYPTGVAVSWAQHHRAPWPGTNFGVLQLPG